MTPAVSGTRMNRDGRACVQRLRRPAWRLTARHSVLHSRSSFHNGDAVDIAQSLQTGVTGLPYGPVATFIGLLTALRRWSV